MIFETFVRKPFVVQAVEITADNIKECARYMGDVRTKDDGTEYILIDPRLVPNVERVYIGFFMTKMGDNVRCYSKKIFRDQFIVLDDKIAPWVEWVEAHGSVEQPAVPAAENQAEVGNRLGVD